MDTPDEVVKDPAAVLDYARDWSSWLVEDDEVTTAVWTAPEGLDIDAQGTVDAVSTVWLSGGTAGVSYDCVNHVLTDAGREDDRILRVHVRNR
jgi:hypothetical protein